MMSATIYYNVMFNVVNFAVSAATETAPTGSSPFDIMLGNMNRLKIFDFFLTWLLFFAIMFAVLRKSEVFGGEISVNGVIAFVVSFFIINYTPVGTTLGAFFSSLFGLAAVIVAGLLVGILFLGMAGIKPNEIFGKDNKTPLAVLLGFLALISFISVGGLNFFNLSSDLMMTLAMIMIMLFAVMFIAKGGGEK